MQLRTYYLKRLTRLKTTGRTRGKRSHKIVWFWSEEECSTGASGMAILMLLWMKVTSVNTFLEKDSLY